MGEIIDLSALGTRDVEQTVTEGRKNPGTGVTEMQHVKRTIPEVQPILTEEEAQIIADADWQSTKGTAFKGVAKFYCKAGGRRFFCDVKPVVKATKRESGKTTNAS